MVQRVTHLRRGKEEHLGKTLQRGMADSGNRNMKGNPPVRHAVEEHFKKREQNV